MGSGVGDRFEHDDRDGSTGLRRLAATGPGRGPDEQWASAIGPAAGIGSVLATRSQIAASCHSHH
jgi:hypothetical protein